MSIAEILTMLGAASACALAGLTLYREKAAFTAVCFSVCLILTAIDVCVGTLSWKSSIATEFLGLRLLKTQIMAVIPGVWLIFSMSYARENPSKSLKDSRLTVGLMFIIPLLLITVFRSHLFSGTPELSASGKWVIALGPAGLALHVCTLAGLVIALMNLERTVRASVGIMRWQIKYLILGAVVLLMARLYVSSQAVLFQSPSNALEIAAGWALLLACISIAYCYRRNHPFKINVYPSRTILNGSVIAVLAGTYLLLVGGLAQLVSRWGGDAAFPLKALLILVSFFGLGVAWMSERFRHQLQHWVSRHFRRSLYDYRHLWMTFTEQTRLTVDEPELCRVMVKWISDTFKVLSVSVWLFDESKRQIRLGASTAFSNSEADELIRGFGGAVELADSLGRDAHVVDLDTSKKDWVGTLKNLHPRRFHQGGHRLCVRLANGDEIIGFLTLGDRVYGIPYSVDDFDFLKCVSDQVAARLHQVELSRRLLSTAEMATFQTMSAFFVHDLKNTASTLSLMLQNLPVHFEDPEFRKDALRGISKSAERINELIQRLSSLRQNNELKFQEVSLIDLLSACTAALKPACHAEIIQDFAPVPTVSIDPEQIQKVATNLILNANDASAPGGRIQISTALHQQWVTFSVQDHGTGMTNEFVNRSLFRPFQTTKKKGIGIGLFHVKMIVEAHRGKIEVESEVNKGTTFRILLPLKKVSP